MTHRSTRNKMRYQVWQAMNKCDKIVEHLKLLDELAQERSDYINYNLPILVAGIDKYKEILAQFREGL